MEIKTAEQIAGTAVNEWLNEYTWPFSERREFSATELDDAVEGLIVRAIEADRAQRQDALSALHEWAVSVSYSMGTDKSNDWSEEIDALVEIEQMYDLVDSDGERMDKWREA